jgi:hypothetical protein
MSGRNARFRLCRGLEAVNLMNNSRDRLRFVFLMVELSPVDLSV